MKTIATVILTFWIFLNIKGQTAAEPGNPESAAGACVLRYADEEWGIEHNATDPHHCQTITIAELPPMSQANTPMDLFITTMGTYSLKKAPGLVIPDEYAVIIEDLLTGQYYNLKSQEPYTFKMNRGFGQTRFVMEISKPNSKVVSAEK